MLVETGTTKEPKIYAAMVMHGLSKTLRLMVCVDEAHKLCNDPKITELAKEARKYGWV
jgi:hypothetical protein